ncbi:mechanosensitive ion channel family protein [Galbibacter mesophilus]|uniref:mechanosensitive ion channel family protein n=1 Tax=Galbibacter mesophilus TaxID=379069 RepID=UPI001F5C2F4A|nr:mechanosensitive ion channel domain-containing protein [Galbibacter mesophilus]MCM5663532.1 mechanosensitive ion channel family protein [Galbibacter mesophilus]
MRIIFFLIYISTFNLLVAQENESKKNKDSINELPKKESVLPKDGVYRSNPIKGYNDAYYELSRVNPSIGLPDNKYNLQTPQATLEHFVVSCRNQKYREAAYALNLNLLPDNITLDQAGELAQKLFIVLDSRVKIDWDGLSDRPDGQTDIQTTTNQAIAGSPRRSVVFGSIDLGERDVMLRLQRVKYKDYGAFWLISGNTVENIEPLYVEYGPRKLDRMMPHWARIKFFNAPIWKLLGTLILMGVSFLVGWIFFRVLKFVFRRFKKEWLTTFSAKLAKPGAIAIGVLFFYVTLNELISFAGPFASNIYAVLLIIVVGSVTWFIMKFIDAFMIYVAENQIGDVSVEENSEARKSLTYISVARRIITFLVTIIGISIVLSQFRSFEKLGISLLASAGVVTVVLGVAAQSTLGNIIAGIQIAITRPAKIGDTVIIDDNWGYVEDITFTYMVVRTWDLRRLVVPLKEIISKTFENWSMTSANQIRPIVLYADYHVDVDKIRAKFKELLESNDKWDKEQAPSVQVTEVTERSVQIRALCSAKDAMSSWDLHCELREQLVKYISSLEKGTYLTRSRNLMDTSWNAEK